MKELTLTPSNTSSSSFTCNSSSTNKWTYDVFLNFRGEDTRNSFTSHLYKALCGAGIHTFIDDRLKRGKEITPTLLEAIEKSRIAIVILSENYASSTFCLKELVKIFECIKQESILPIFYKVDPSDVRHLRRSYQEALVGHEKRFKNNEEEVQNWKSALHKVANLSGWPFEERYGHEYEFIEKIVEEVSKRINRTPLHVAKYPVGLKSQVEDIISLLDLGSEKKIIMVGIHGIGGIGKTTIACAVYNVIMDQFESACFLFDVRERSYKHSLVELQNTLLFELTAEKGTKIENFRVGIPIIRRRLCQKKVLLILDDVNSKEQLEALAGGVDWFGFGSRIIMTTRNKHLLDVHDVKRHYEVKELCFQEALELFRWSAFKNNEVDSRYTSIINRVTNYCNGLPLALEVIGSNLFSKTQEEWESALDIYEKVPNKNVQDTLKLSYTSLGENEQEIFLDIACFFNHYHLSTVKSILINGRGYDPTYGIGVLEKNSLIRINQDRVKIHDLVVQMGREIVRSQSPSNPGNWSRLWSYKDILSVLEENKGSDRIEFLMLNMPQSKEVLWNGEAFKKMKNLKILIIGNAYFSCKPKYLSNSLRMLEWKNYSWPSLPCDFHPRSLVILYLSRSSLRFVKLFKNFESLTEMDLSHSQFLKQVGDISEAVNLRELDISYCKNLIEVHRSVGFLGKLARLFAMGCTKLSTFPCSIKSASLEVLNLTGCFSLQSIPQKLKIIENHLIPNFRVDSSSFSPETLILSTLRGDLEIICGIWMLPKLENWNEGIQHFNKCSLDDQENVSSAMSVNLSVWRRCDRNMINIYLSVWHPYYCNLTKLTLQCCNLTDDFLYQRLPWFPNLVDLFLGYNRFTVLPECMNGCHHLRILELGGCKDLREIKGIPPNIEHLSTVNCTSLTPQSSKILLSKAFHEDMSRGVVVPGFRIPKWMDHSCRRSSISFWFRNEFPRLVLCFVSSISLPPIHIQIFINGIEFHSDVLNWKYNWSVSETPCISMGDLHEWDKKFKKELKKDEWNHVIIFSDRKDFYGMGVHVYKKEKGPNNVRFIDSKRCIISHDRDLISGFSLQNKFCPFLDMRVCDFINSHRGNESLYHMLDSEKFSAESSEARVKAAEKAIQIMLAPTKVKVLVWGILNDYSSPQSLKLPTCCDLFKKKLVKSPMCPICETNFETTEHVFFECSWTRPLWFGSDLDWAIKDRLLSNGGTSWLEQKFEEITEIYPNGKSVTGLMGNILWAIWKARNEFILEDKPVNPLEALMTAKAMHVKYSSHLSLVETGSTQNGPALKTSISTTHPEVEYKVKSKRKILSINNNELEPTCDKGTEIENKAKRKRGESNSNTEMQPNCHKENVKGTKVNYKDKQKGKIVSNNNSEMEPTCDKDNVKSAEVDNYKLKPKRKIASSSNAEKEHIFDKGTQVENKAKRKREEESSDNIEMEPNCHKDESMLQPFANITQEPIVEIAQSQENESLDNETFVNENTPEENPITNQTIVDAETEISFDSHSTSKVLEEQIHVLPKLNIFDTTLGSYDFDFRDGDDDPISKLASLLSMDEEVLASQSTQARNKDKSTEIEDERGSTIKKAMLTLSECFQIDLWTIHSTPDTKAKLVQAIQFLQSVTAKDDITIGCKSFVDNLAEYLPTFWEQLSKVPEVKSKHAKLVQRKQDLIAFSHVALFKRQQFIEKCSSAKKARDENSGKIQALEQQIANLQVELQSCQSQHLELEHSFKQVNEERTQFNLEAKQVVDYFMGMKGLLKSVENELQETLSAEASAKLQWQELQKIFNNSLKKFMD